MKPSRRPTILDVNPDQRERDWEEDFLDRLEVHVETCGGPGSFRACPLLHGEPCPKVEGADGILFQLDLDRSEHREILARYTENFDVPIRVITDDAHRARYAEELEDVEVATPPVGPAQLDAFDAEVESEME